MNTKHENQIDELLVDTHFTIPYMARTLLMEPSYHDAGWTPLPPQQKKTRLRYRRISTGPDDIACEKAEVAVTVHACIGHHVVSPWTHIVIRLLVQRQGGG